MVWSLVVLIVVTLPWLLETRERSDLVRSVEYSHQLPGQGSMMSVTRLYPGHSVGHNDTYIEPSSERDNNDDKTMYHQTSRPGPFAPRFRVPRWEISDQEWSQEIQEGFSGTGIVPEILSHHPAGLININYNLHSCIHMGNWLSASVTQEMPQVSWPVLRGRRYSLAMLETGSLLLHWLVVNISGSDISSGKTVVSYHPPPPSQSSAQFLMVALLQSGMVGREVVTLYPQYPHTDTPCLHAINFRRILQHLQAELVVAANYWRMEESRPQPHQPGSYQVCQHLTV